VTPPLWSFYGLEQGRPLTIIARGVTFHSGVYVGLREPPFWIFQEMGAELGIVESGDDEDGVRC